MLKIGRYKIVFGIGKTFVVQTRGPTTVWRFLLFWVFKEARPDDVDRKKNFPIGTGMEYEGRVYHYYKAGGDVKKQEPAVKPKEIL